MTWRVVGRVVGLFVADEGGSPMRPARSVATDGLRGLEGDRYASGRGYWSRSGYRCEPVTLIAAEDLEEAARLLGTPVEGRTVRRNVVTRGVTTAALVGRRFRIGNVELEGTRSCDPCRYLERLVRIPGLEEVLEGRGGVRAVLRSAGVLTHGDTLRMESPTRDIVDTDATTP